MLKQAGYRLAPDYLHQRSRDGIKDLNRVAADNAFC